MESNRVPHVKKTKKKQVKDELDRMKQAEKKRRRLEKALATSAAIRTELEKKKQMKKEEQQRLDEEGAAIAEAVALHVLIGEDPDDSCKILLKKDDEMNQWRGTADDIDLFMNTRSAYSNDDLQRCAFQSIRELPSSDDGYGYSMNHFGYGGWSLPSRPSERSFPLPYLEAASWGSSDVSAGFSSLQLGDAQVDTTVFFNRF